MSVVVLIGLAALAGIGTETFGIMWDTSMQQEIPQEKLSRVYSSTLSARSCSSRSAWRSPVASQS